MEHEMETRVCSVVYSGSRCTFSLGLRGSKKCGVEGSRVRVLPRDRPVAAASWIRRAELANEG